MLPRYQIWACFNTTPEQEPEPLQVIFYDLEEALEACKDMNEDAREEFEVFGNPGEWSSDIEPEPEKWFEVREVLPEERF